jgi:hypothetical protein
MGAPRAKVCNEVFNGHPTHLDRVAGHCHDALDEDVIVQADKAPEGLDGGIVEDGPQQGVAQGPFGLPKQAPVRVEDYDIPCSGGPAPAASPQPEHEISASAVSNQSHQTVMSS